MDLGHFVSRFVAFYSSLHIGSLGLGPWRIGELLSPAEGLGPDSKERIDRDPEDSNEGSIGILVIRAPRIPSDA